jgi:hypothetical protein
MRLPYQQPRKGETARQQREYVDVSHWAISAVEAAILTDPPSGDREYRASRRQRG